MTMCCSQHFISLTSSITKAVSTLQPKICMHALICAILYAHYTCFPTVCELFLFMIYDGTRHVILYSSCHKGENVSQPCLWDVQYLMLLKWFFHSWCVWKRNTINYVLIIVYQIIRGNLNGKLHYNAKIEKGGIRDLGKYPRVNILHQRNSHALSNVMRQN